MAIDFPQSPAAGAQFTAGATSYEYDGEKWISTGTSPNSRLARGSNTLEITTGNDLVWTGDSVLLGTATTNVNDRLTIHDPGSAFMSIRSDVASDGNSQVLDFGVGTADRSSFNLTAVIAADIHSTSGGTLKSDLVFQTNSGNSISERLRIKDTGTVTFNNPTYNSPALIHTDAKDNTSYAPPTAYPANQIEIQNSVSMGAALMRFRSQSDNASAGIWNVGAVPRSGSLKSDFVFQSRTADSTYSEIARFSGDGGLKFVGQSAAVRGTMTSETFSAYEEGTYTPNWLNCTNCVYDSSSSASYTRIGRIVIVSGIIAFTTYTTFTNGWDQITLPFIGSDSPSGGTNGVGYWAVSAGGTGQGTDTLNFGPLDGPGSSASAAFTNIFRTGTNGMGNANLNTIFTSSSTLKQVRFNITYHTDAA